MEAPINKSLTITTKQIAAPWLRIIGVLVFLATLYKIVTLTFFDVSLLVYVISNLIAIAIWTAKEIVVVDFKTKQIGEGFSILWISSLDKVEFTGFEKIFINRLKMVATFRHLTITTDIHHVTYKAFLKTDEGDKICIGENKDKDDLIAKLKEYNKELKTAIFDTSDAEAIQIE